MEAKRSGDHPTDDSVENRAYTFMNKDIARLRVGDDAKNQETKAQLSFCVSDTLVSRGGVAPNTIVFALPQESLSLSFNSNPPVQHHPNGRITMPLTINTLLLSYIGKTSRFLQPREKNFLTDFAFQPRWVIYFPKFLVDGTVASCYNILR